MRPSFRLGACVVLSALALGAAACLPQVRSAIPALPKPSVDVTPSPAPSPAPSPSERETTQPPECEATGEFRPQVMVALARLGYDIDDECAAIKNFQQRFELSPVDGVAGPGTYDVARRLVATDPSRCDAGDELTACIDLTNQTTWLMRGDAVVYGPTVIRTGMPGYATPAGRFQVDWRDRRAWSEPYEVWLPYWQSFNGDMGLHETTTYLHHAEIGSHGCANLLHDDAVAYWDRLREGSQVHIFGHRPGT